MTSERRPTTDCGVCGEPTISKYGIHASHWNEYQHRYYDKNLRSEDRVKVAADRAERRYYVTQLRKQGLTLQAIADRCGLTRQRIHQILQY
jgi:hypothetical protein